MRKLLFIFVALALALATQAAGTYVHGYYRSNGTYVHGYNRGGSGTSSGYGNLYRHSNPTQSNNSVALSTPKNKSNGWFRTWLRHLATSSTYRIGSTTYSRTERYSSTGLPVVIRSESNVRRFLRHFGLSRIPQGYQVDHIIPLSEGGTDDPSNMQLLTTEQHRRKTAEESESHWRR